MNTKNIPRWLISLEERIKENLPEDESETFHSQFLESIYKVSYLGNPKNKLSVLRLEKVLTYIESNKKPYAEDCKKVIRDIIDELSREEPRVHVLERLAKAAGAAAWAARAAGAAAWAARAAREVAAWAAAWAAEAAGEAAWAPAWAAEAAAWAAAEAAGAAAEKEHWRWEADTLLRILSEYEQWGTMGIMDGRIMIEENTVKLLFPIEPRSIVKIFVERDLSNPDKLVFFSHDLLFNYYSKGTIKKKKFLEFCRSVIDMFGD